MAKDRYRIDTMTSRPTSVEIPILFCNARSLVDHHDCSDRRFLYHVFFRAGRTRRRMRRCRYYTVCDGSHSGGKGLAKKIVPLRKIINGVVFSRWLTSSTSITQMVQQTIIMRPATTIDRRRITSCPRHCSYIMF